MGKPYLYTPRKGIKPPVCYPQARMTFMRDTENFIFISDEIAPVDALIILGAPWIELIKKASSLYHQGITPKIIACGKYSLKSGKVNIDRLPEQYRKAYRTEAEMIKDILTEHYGVPAQAVIEEDESTNTLENAANGIKILQESGNAQTIGICCQAFHARRAQMTFESVAPEYDYRIYPADTQGITKDNWSQSEYGISRVMGELERCGRYFPTLNTRS